MGRRLARAAIVSAFGCACGAAGDGPAAPGASASATEPVRFYAYECKAEKKPLDWFQWSPDRKALLTAGRRTVDMVAPDQPVPEELGVVDLWRPADGARVATLELGKDIASTRLLVVGFDAKGMWAVSPGALDGEGQPIIAWNLVTGATRKFTETVGWPAEVLVSPDRSRAIVLGGGGDMVSIDLADPKVVATVAADPDLAPTSNIRFSKDGSVLLQRATVTGLLRRDARTLALLDTFTGYNQVSTDGAQFIGIMDGEVGFYDAVSGKRLRSVGALEATYASLMSFSPDNARVAILGDSLIVFDVKTGERLAHVPVESGTQVDWTPDGQVISTGYRIFNTKSWTFTDSVDPVFVRRAAEGHVLDRFEGDTLVGLDGLTMLPTGPSFELKGAVDVPGVWPTFEISEDGAFITFVNVADQTVRVLRTKDHALLDLGVAFVDGVPRGWAATPTGSYDGPEAAAGCAPKTGKGRRVVGELMKKFFAGQPVE